MGRAARARGRLGPDPGLASAAATQSPTPVHRVRKPVPEGFKEGKSLLAWSEGGFLEEVEQEGFESTGFFKFQK